MSQMDPQLRKRILMFYFAAGINLVMATWVVSVGSGQVASGTLTTITIVFIVFAGLNYYVARYLQKKWAREVRRQGESSPAPQRASEGAGDPTR